MLAVSRAVLMADFVSNLLLQLSCSVIEVGVHKPVRSFAIQVLFKPQTTTVQMVAV